MIQKGGLYINGVQVKEDGKIDRDSLLEGQVMIVRLGKSTFRIIEMISGEDEAIPDRLEA